MNKGAKVFLLFLIFSCISCGSNLKDDYVSVMIEQGENYIVTSPFQNVKRGNDITFQISLLNNAVITSVDYSNYEISGDTGIVYLKLFTINYPLVVEITTTTERITYDSNGGLFGDKKTLITGKDNTHLKFHTYNKIDNFKRDGYVLKSWIDKDNNEILLGSSCNNDIDTLNANWIKETSSSFFEYSNINGLVHINKYIGDEKNVVIPLFINNLQVISLASNCFVNKNIDTLVLSYNLQNINKDAFVNCNVTNLYIYDNLYTLKDESFTNTNIKHLFINALREPSYSKTYYSTFNDKMYYLESIKDKKKIILFSGSSTRYGYNSPLFEESFPEYKVVNMGVFAYFSAKVQLDIFSQFLKEGDVIIDAPEFDSIEFQMFRKTEFEKRLFYMFEGSYQYLSYVDISQYENVFDSYTQYQDGKFLIDSCSYADSCLHYDDDGNYYKENIYNINGDFSLKRKGSVSEGILYQQRVSYLSNAFLEEDFTSYNSVIDEFKKKGIDFLFNYAPRNIQSLTFDSTIEEREKTDVYLKRKINTTFLSSIEDFLYEPIDFYLIDNHLTSSGAYKRSEKTITSLKAYFADNL